MTLRPADLDPVDLWPGRMFRLLTVLVIAGTVGFGISAARTCR
ncbi:hypothetical protein [Actinoplanes sp. NBRC 103695]|nr:hypothetical protein [Actinoplanes sp. NBRC 103695]GLY98133.1 hypothetical protein Acsp02_53870 [Actinoplanes sp. NBRC 103695]